MKKYINHKFKIVHDDNDIIVENTRTDAFCIYLSIIAILLFLACIAFTATAAKAESKEYAKQANQELCNLMEFNGSTYHCED